MESTDDVSQVTITFGEPIDPVSQLAQNAPDANSEASQEVAYAATATSGTTASETTTSETTEAVGSASPRIELAQAERLMMQWGSQVLAMAGRPDFTLEVAGRSRLKRLESSERVDTAETSANATPESPGANPGSPNP